MFERLFLIRFELCQLQGIKNGLKLYNNPATETTTTMTTAKTTMTSTSMILMTR